MLQVVNSAIVEQAATTMTTTTGGTLSGANCVDYGYFGNTGYYWHTYPVYVCTDKTKKAIDILKHLEKEKLVKVASVSRFIDLVEQIAAIL